MKAPKLSFIAKFILRSLLALKPSEKFLVVTDPLLFSVAAHFAEGAESIGAASFLNVIPTGKMHGEEPPPNTAVLLSEVDVALLITKFSLSHTKARKQASRKGVRMASLPGATSRMLIRAVPISYKALSLRAAQLVGHLNRAKEVVVRTKKGTNISFSASGRRAYVDSGIYNYPHAFGNLPAGEVCLAPQEGTARGRVVVDGSIPYLGKLSSPLVFDFEKGFLVKLRGKGSKLLRSILSSKGKAAFNLAEFGIGLNPRARLTGDVLEDEKVLGSVHFDLGNNISFGGSVNVPLHIDAVVRSPWIFLDKKRLKV